MKRSIVLLIVILLFSAFAVAACGKKATPAPEGEATAVATRVAKAAAGAEATEAPEATQAPEPAEAVEPTVAPEPASADEADLSVSDRQSGLDQLDSYKAAWSSSWETVEDGKTKTGKWGWTEEIVRQPPASRILWNMETSDEDPTGMEIIRVGDMNYMVLQAANGEKNCMASTTDEQDSATSGMFSPNSLGSISGAKLVGRDTVNGIPARHYRYDEKGASLVGLGKITGDVWVSTEGEYVVKETTSWEGGAGPFGAALGGTDGKGEWTWEVTEINQPIDIQPPEACKTAASELPMLPDASDKILMGPMTSYLTASSMKEVTDFYRQELRAAGWEEQEGGMVTDEFVMLTFMKDGKSAQLTASPEDGKTRVSITMSE
jgi:hypothetical protein